VALRILIYALEAASVGGLFHFSTAAAFPYNIAFGLSAHVAPFAGASGLFLAEKLEKGPAPKYRYWPYLSPAVLI
jgi:hypothetical protein